MRLAIVTSHPIQYNSPLFAELARHVPLKVLFAHRATPAEQASAGFGTSFDWDIDLLNGFEHVFLGNRASRPGTGHFTGCDTPTVYDALRSGGFDAVLLTGWHLKSYWQALFAAKRLGKPVLVRTDSQLSAQRNPYKRAIKTLAYPAMLRLFDRIVYTGARSRAYLDHYHYPRERQFYSPHCVDTQWFAQRATASARAALRAELGIPEDTTVLLFAGKLVEFKRPLDVVAIAREFQSRGRKVRVLVAGAGPLSHAVSQCAMDAGIRLDALGFCNQSRMPFVYAAADVLVLPSNGRETWGLVANEALACSTPVALSREAGCSDDLGRLVDVATTFTCGDTSEAAAKIDALLLRPREPSAFALANEQFGMARAAQAIIGASEHALT